MLPVAGPHDAGVLAALLVAVLARLRAIDPLLLDGTVVDDGHRVVAAETVVSAIDLAWKDVVHLRFPRRVRHLRLRRKVDLEAVFLADVLHPLLCERRPADR